MKKKHVLFVCVAALVLIGGVTLAMFLVNQPNDENIGGGSIINAPDVVDNSEEFESVLGLLANFDIGYFDLAFYARFIRLIPSDRVVGPIEDEEMAKEGALEAWSDRWGRGIMNSREYRVQFDIQNDIWFVQGILPPNTLGIQPSVLIRGSDGQVLAVWG
ncbi:MAG: hypothetical protein FWC72_06580 [Oscillospiraceae bacterium]|nr:hypothetical protein [Oscillospiraceae bacterium]